ncbi:LacI family DNA-binding transcriptional regulator [Radiobacillus sp. PE A8.2]|uniref:LacI family DNA-binding transcriptional regulator n=1 Tax=Radiobacillus sp. PE A8.2 TaxID=3380349 RepID=UPI0038911074
MVKKKITIRDIAKESGVSVATVSRYINKVSYTSEETEKKIQKVLDEFNYTPNAIARGLAKQKSNAIAFVTPDITNPFFPEIVKSIESIAKKQGYSLLLINTNENDLESTEFWNRLKSRYIDGFILAESDLSSEVRTHLDSLNIPFVRIDRAVNSDKDNSVSVNNYEGARLATQHLIEVGCQKIAHISGPTSQFPALGRLKGYKSVMDAYGREVIVYQGGFTLDSGAKETEVLLRDHSDVDGIFYSNDLMAIGALRAFKKLGISIPKDVAIIGFDGIQLTEIVIPEISTIRQPIEKIGEIATNNLINAIENPDTEYSDNIILDVELIKRESTIRGK